MVECHLAGQLCLDGTHTILYYNMWPSDAEIAAQGATQIAG